MASTSFGRTRVRASNGKGVPEGTGRGYLGAESVEAPAQWAAVVAEFFFFRDKAGVV